MGSAIPKEWKKYREIRMANLVALNLLLKAKEESNVLLSLPPKTVKYYELSVSKDDLSDITITIDEKDLETMDLLRKLFGEEVRAKLEGSPIIIATPVPAEKQKESEVPLGVKEIKPLGEQIAVAGGSATTTQAPSTGAMPGSQPVAGAPMGGFGGGGGIAYVPAEIKTEKIEIKTEDKLLNEDNPEEYYESLEDKLEEILKLYSVRKYSKKIEEAKEGKIKYDLYEFPEVLKGKIPTAHVQILFSDEIGEFWYVITDYMQLNEEERKHYEVIRKTLLETPNYVSRIVELLGLEGGDIEKRIIETTIEWVNFLWGILKIPYPIGSQQYTKIIINILREFVGFGKINYLFADKKNIEDVTYVGVNKPVFIRYKPLQNWVKVLIYDRLANQIKPLTFTTVDDANDFVRLLSQKANQYVNLAKATADGRLPDGSRLHVKYGSVYTDPKKGSVFTIRFKSESVVLPLDLIAWGTIPPLAMAFGWMTIENVDTASLLVVGGTGVGKTTTMQSLLLFIPEDRKILTIEDTPELELPHENWEANYYDSSRQEDMVILLKSALRSRPDYIVIQEVRGAETEIMFQAMASGHAGLSTFHAGSFERLINRLTTKPIDLPEGLIGTLRQVWIQKWVTGEDNQPMRRVTDVIEIVSEGGQIKGVPLFKYDPDTRILSPTEALYKRVHNPESVMFKTMIYNGFKKTQQLYTEMENRAFFLRSLADLYSIYKKRADIMENAKDQYQKEALSEVVNFWEFYKEKVREKMRKSFRKGEPSMYQVFFQILFEYKYNPQFFSTVMKLASENIPPLLEFIER